MRQTTALFCDHSYTNTRVHRLVFRDEQVFCIFNIPTEHILETVINIYHNIPFNLHSGALYHHLEE